MTTGAGTGTPATGASSTITTVRDRLEQELSDNTNAQYTTALLDEALRQAIERYSRVNPAAAIGTITLASSAREISLTSLTGLVTVSQVWLPYDATDLDEEPTWRKFWQWPGGKLFIADGDAPDAGDVARVWYTKAQTLNGLDGASETTIPESDISLVITAASSIAAYARAKELAEAANADPNTLDQLRKYGYSRNIDFQTHIKKLAAQAADAGTDIAPIPALDRWDKGDDGW